MILCILGVTVAEGLRTGSSVGDKGDSRIEGSGDDVGCIAGTYYWCNRWTTLCRALVDGTTTNGGARAATDRAACQRVYLVAVRCGAYLRIIRCEAAGRAVAVAVAAIAADALALCLSRQNCVTGWAEVHRRIVISACVGRLAGSVGRPRRSGEQAHHSTGV
ncbi:hypothetical protein ACI65C_005685 [Semiaphis heraclei]